MKRLLFVALVSVFTLGACASSGSHQRDTASSERNYYRPIGLDLKKD